MNPMLIDLNIIFVFVISVQFSNSLNVFVLDTKGHIAKLNEPFHINEEQAPKYMRDRFERQLAELLISKQQPHKNLERNFANSKDNLANTLGASKPKHSIVIFSNGRYTLDLDKLDFKKALNESIINDNDCESFDSEECFEQFYETENNTQESDGLPGKPSSNKIDSLRKNIEKSNADQDSSSSEYITILRHGKNSIVRRFKIINNSSKKKRKKVWSSDTDSSQSSEEAAKKIKKKYYKSSYEEDSSMSSKEVHNSLSDEKKKDSYEESPEEDEDEVYLQGNILVPMKHRNDYDKTKRSHHKNLDARRRLPHFLPKRYHWNPNEIKHLGYFWYNGPRGRYPEAVPL
ncbi:unnamed protein product [Arctia plantaginis]|uniref:Uncharacterized protein n=1 Tax=Arctia plantaginis TaxID=874455 RepID=A0A8S1BER3_ARCPL|nr:unnamed protein product [Arctia plantaginis]